MPIPPWSEYAAPSEGHSALSAAQFDTPYVNNSEGTASDARYAGRISSGSRAKPSLIRRVKRAWGVW